MMSDFVAETLENCWCKDCLCHSVYHWSNGIWCFGQIKKGKSNPRCDVIRWCDKIGYVRHIQEYSPDEVLILTSMLTKITSWWLWDNEEYRRFKLHDN